MKKKAKTFEVTEDGRYLFRPFGILGAACEIPDRGGFDTARYISWGMVIVIMAAAVANIFFHQLLVFMLLILGVFACYMLWLMSAKSDWKRLV